MTQYDQQYQQEPTLFGAPYPEFEAFVKAHPGNQGKALDIGCGQGRDSLMLARHGYQVTGVDSSKVGIEQMLRQAKVDDLPVTGIVNSFHEFEPEQNYDAIVLDSILHFEKADRKNELALLDRLYPRLNPGGYLFIFVHKSRHKEQTLHDWLDRQPDLELIQGGYIDYTYEETSTDFNTQFQMYLFFLQRA